MRSFKNKKNIKTLICSLLVTLASASTPLFSVEEYVSNIYKEIDRVFVIRSDEQLNKILHTNQDDKYYYLIENYTEKKIRRLVINDDYEFAMTAIVIVIENNLDNEQAIEMYSSIADAYELQKQTLVALQAQKELENARREAEREKQKTVLNKNYVSATNASGNSVYVSGKETKLANYTFKGMLGLGNIAFLKNAENSTTSTHYGLSADLSYEYNTNNLVFGFDTFGSFRFLSFGDEELQSPLLYEIDIAPKFGIGKNFFIRTGFAGIFQQIAKEKNSKDFESNNFYSPLVGIELERIPLGSLSLDVGLDYYPGHVFNPSIDLAAGGKVNLSIPYATVDKVKLTFNLGFRDILYIKNSQIENRASVILAIGAENVIK